MAWRDWKSIFFCMMPDSRRNRHSSIYKVSTTFLFSQGYFVTLYMTGGAARLLESRHTGVRCGPPLSIQLF